MTDEEALALAPAVTEFVNAVNDQEQAGVQACFMYTPPETLAVLTAGWVGELLNKLDAMRAEAAEERATYRASLAESIRDLSRMNDVYQRMRRGYEERGQIIDTQRDRITYLRGEQERLKNEMKEAA